MATILQDKDEEQPQQPQQQAPQAGPGQGQPLYTAPSQNQAKGSGRFTNISKYLNANQGGGQQLQQGILNKQDQQAEQIRQGVQASQQKFQQAYTPEKQRLDEGQQLTQNIFKPDADLKGLSPQQIQQFRNIASSAGAYQDLTGLENAPTVDPLQKASQAAGTESGRFNLLKQTFTNPTYTRGQQRLDQLLLGLQNPQNLQRNLKQQLQDTSQFVTQAQVDAKAQADALKLQGQDVATLANTNLTNAQTGLNTELQNRMQQATQQQATDQQMLMDLFSGKVGQGDQAAQNVTQLLSKLGLNPNDKLYLPPDISANAFINPAQQATLGGVATDEEKARYQVLQQLAGIDTPSQLQGDAFDPMSYFNRENFGNQQSEIGQRASNSADARLVRGLEPAIQLQQDLQSGIDPLVAMGKAVNAGLDPEVMSNLISGSREFQGRSPDQLASLLLPNTLLTAIAGQGSGGMRANYSSLQDRLNAQAFLPTYLQQIDAAKKNLKQSFGETTVQDLISKYATLPMRNF